MASPTPENGWIKAHRKMVDWEWFSTKNMFHLFMYLLLKANHKDRKWRGKMIKRGQLATGLFSINENTGISIQSIRTCLSRLESTGEITRKSTNKYTVITICNYEIYQDTKKETNKQSTNNQQTTNNQSTTNKNDKNVKNDKNTTDSLDRESSSVSKKSNCPYQKIIDLYHEILPTLPQVLKLSAQLKKRIKVRWNENPDIEWWRWYFDGVSQCPFLIGKVKDWTADFYWLLGPKNMTKVLNGAYTDKHKSHQDKLLEVGQKWMEKKLSRVS